MKNDSIDLLLLQWQVQRPDLEISSLGLLGRVLRAEKYLASRLTMLLQAHHLQIGEYDVLATLRTLGAPYRSTPGELMDKLLLSSGAMTNRIDGLEKKKLVQREPSYRDRRSIGVVLTSPGLILIDKLMSEYIETTKDAFKHLSGDEQEQLTLLLRRLLEGLEPTRLQK
jgi:DNA-binding MarR family transcriptional regulator